MANGKNDENIKQAGAEIQANWAKFKNPEPALEAPAWYADPINYVQLGGAGARAGIRGIGNYAASGLEKLGIMEGASKVAAPGLASKLPSGEIKDVANLTSWIGNKLGMGGKGFVNKSLDTASKNPISTLVSAANAPQNFETNPVNGITATPPIEKPPVVQPLPINPTPPVGGGPGSLSVNVSGVGGGMPTLEKRAEDSIPSWGRKGGWDVVGKKGPNGMGMIPEDITATPTVGRISTKDRPGKGILGAKLETDTADTTLIPNPNYNKGVVDGYGYGKRGMGGNAHIDDRKYLEVPNQYKGEKVPLIEAVGFKRKPANETERIMMDPSSYDKATGELKKSSRAQLGQFGIAKEQADAHRDAARISAEAHKEVAKYGLTFKSLEKDIENDDKSAKQIWEQNKVEYSDEAGVKNIDPTSTMLNIAEQHAMGKYDWQKLPKSLQKPVVKVMQDFDTFVSDMQKMNPGMTRKEVADKSWPVYKKVRRGELREY